MAGGGRYTALLDACVLFPPRLAADEFAASFEKHGLPRMAQRLREASRLI